MHLDGEKHREKARIFADERDKLLVEKERNCEKIFELTSTVAYLTAQILSKNTRITELEQKQWREASLQDGPDLQELVAAHELNGRLQLQIIDLDEELKRLENERVGEKEKEKLITHREALLAEETKKLQATIAELESEREEFKKGKEIAENSANAWHGHAQLQAKSALAWEAEAKSIEVRITELQGRLNGLSRQEEKRQNAYEEQLDHLSLLMSKRLQNPMIVRVFYKWRVQVEKKRVQTVRIENKKLADQLENYHSLVTSGKSSRRSPPVHHAPFGEVISLWSLVKILFLLVIVWVFLVIVGFEHVMTCQLKETYRVAS